MKHLVFALLFVSLLGCSKNDADIDTGSITIFYLETQCSDPWVRPGSTLATGWPTDELRARAIIKYLQDNRVTSARNVRFTEVAPIYTGGANLAPSNGIAICQACTCPSGRRIDLTIGEPDWEQAKKLGFKRQ